EALGILQQPHRTFQKTEIRDRRRDLAVLDQEQTVARQTGVLQGLLIDEPDIPEVRNQQAAFHRRDELIQRRIAALHDEAGRGPTAAASTLPTTSATAPAESTAGAGRRLLSSLPGPVAIVRQVRDRALIDPRHGSRRQQIRGPRR